MGPVLALIASGKTKVDAAKAAQTGAPAPEAAPQATGGVANASGAAIYFPRGPVNNPAKADVPTLPAPKVEVIVDHDSSRVRYQNKSEFLISSLHLCGNTGTYVDSPLHRYREGADLAALPLDRLAHVPARVFDAHTLGVLASPRGCFESASAVTQVQFAPATAPVRSSALPMKVFGVTRARAVLSALASAPYGLAARV